MHSRARCAYAFSVFAGQSPYAYPYHCRYIAPTIIVEPHVDSPLMTEEIFGPILPIIGVDSIDAAVGARSRSLPTVNVYLCLYLRGTGGGRTARDPSQLAWAADTFRERAGEAAVRAPPLPLPPPVVTRARVSGRSTSSAPTPRRPRALSTPRRLVRAYAYAFPACPARGIHTYPIAGGVGVNETAFHIVNPYLPFGANGCVFACAAICVSAS